nr:hypothetical protein [Tanacetum cinerariifolium]
DHQLQGVRFVVEGDGEEEGPELHKETIMLSMSMRMSVGIVLLVSLGVEVEEETVVSLAVEGEITTMSPSWITNKRSLLGQGGCNSQGRGRRDYNNDSYMDNQQEAEGYNQDPMQG